MPKITSSLFYEKLGLNIFDGVYPPFEDSFLLASTIPPDLRGKKVFDLCTGSGLLGIIALRRGAEEVTFADRNKDAVACAKHNVEKNRSQWERNISSSNPKAPLLHFVEGSLFDGLAKIQFDFIVINPPYLPSDEELSNAVRDGGFAGRETIDLFLNQLPSHLSEKGVCHLLQSSANGNEETMRRLKALGLEGKTIATNKNFFVELVVFEIGRLKK